MLSIEDIKLNPEKLPEGWRLVNEIFVSSEELPNFEEKFGAGVENVLNQFISAEEGNVQVNYILSLDPENAGIVERKMNDLVGCINTVLLKENVVVEIISDELKLKEKIIDILERQRKGKDE